MGKKRGGLFDFNHDGKESIGEMYVGYQMYKNWLRRKEEKNSKADYSFVNPVDDSWRDYCEDGSEYDIDPDDYEMRAYAHSSMNLTISRFTLTSTFYAIRAHVQVLFYSTLTSKSRLSS